MAEDLADLMFNLFLGSDLAFGKSLYTGKTTAAGKKETRNWTEKKAVTSNDWKAHLQGRCGIGIIPINSLGSVTWGAIDVDNYAIDPVEINRIIQEKHMPLVPCLSKSGGMHLFLFCKEWIPAEKMVLKLDAIAAALGFGTCEIFPKQSSVRVDQEDFGNWINMPYFGSKDRLCLNTDGTKITEVADFIAFAEAKRMTADSFNEFDPKEATNKLLPDGPPCLNIMWEQTNHEGHRNVLLANTCVYLKKAFPENWSDKLEEFNRKLATPLSASELSTLLKSYGRKDYKYQCQDCHMKPFCNASECKRRRFGISESGVLINNRSLTKIKTDPPIWFLDIVLSNGTPKRVSLATEDLQSPSKFQLRCMADLNIMPAVVKQAEWETMVTRLLEHVAEVEVPPESTPMGRFKEILAEFLQNNSESESFDCLKRGGIFKDDLAYYFRFSDLMLYLVNKRFTSFNRGQATTALQSLGGNTGRRRTAGENLRYWTVPTTWEDLESPEPLAQPEQKDVF